MNFTEGFGKSWIDRILGKVDKDQGVANAGKVLGIGNDGQVVPVEQSGGGGGTSATVTTYTPATFFTALENGTIKVGDVIFGSISFYSSRAVANTVVNIGTNESPLLRIKYTGATNSKSVSRTIACEILTITKNGESYDIDVVPCTIEGTNKNNGSFTYNETTYSYTDLNRILKTIKFFRSSASDLKYEYVGEDSHNIIATDNIVGECIEAIITQGGLGSSLAQPSVVHK